MSETSTSYHFTPHQRWAVFTVHGEICYICREPLNYRECEIDHIIARSLRGKPELAKVCEQLGRPESFDVDSAANWSPTCRRCNSLKRERSWDPSLLIQLHLQIAADRAPKVAELIERQVSDRQIANAVGLLERAAAQGLITPEIVPSIKEVLTIQEPYRTPERKEKPVRLTPELEVLSDREGFQIVRGPYGVGGRHTLHGRDPSWDCPNCGSAAAWSGARCVICGMLSDD